MMSVPLSSDRHEKSQLVLQISRHEGPLVELYRECRAKNSWGGDVKMEEKESASFGRRIVHHNKLLKRLMPRLVMI